MLEFSVNMDLKPNAKFNENLINTFRERTILNFSLAMSVFRPCCDQLMTYISMALALRHPKGRRKPGNIV